MNLRRRSGACAAKSGRVAEKLEKIKAVYGEFCKEENPLRQQIKRMKTELEDLLSPILSV